MQIPSPGNGLLFSLETLKQSSLNKFEEAHYCKLMILEFPQDNVEAKALDLKSLPHLIMKCNHFKSLYSLFVLVLSLELTKKNLPH